MTAALGVIPALTEVMRQVQGVAKRDRNDAQRFNFRGIDAVVNAVGPALRDHGVVIVPLAQEMTSESYATAKGAQMRNVCLRVDWQLFGPDGSSIHATTYGEAADAGDKAVSKAHSVAYRTLLLQALCIPTDEPDPDSQAHERAAQTAQPAGRTAQRLADLALHSTSVTEVESLWREAAAAGHLDAGVTHPDGSLRELRALMKDAAERLKGDAA